MSELEVNVSPDGYLGSPGRFVLLSYHGERWTAAVPLRSGVSPDDAKAKVQAAFAALRGEKSVVDLPGERATSVDYEFTQDDILNTFQAVLDEIT